MVKRERLVKGEIIDLAILCIQQERKALSSSEIRDMIIDIAGVEISTNKIGGLISVLNKTFKRDMPSYRNGRAYKYTVIKGNKASKIKSIEEFRESNTLI